MQVNSYDYSLWCDITLLVLLTLVLFALLYELQFLQSGEKTRSFPFVFGDWALSQSLKCDTIFMYQWHKKFYQIVIYLGFQPSSIFKSLKEEGRRICHFTYSHISHFRYYPFISDAQCLYQESLPSEKLPLAIIRASKKFSWFCFRDSQGNQLSCFTSITTKSPQLWLIQTF